MARGRDASLPSPRAASWVTLQGTGHAVPATPSLPHLEAVDLDDVDAGLAVLLVAVDVLRVRDDDAGLQRDDVVAAVPLLALLLRLVASRRDDVELLVLQPHRVGDRAEEALLRPYVERPRVLAGTHAVRLHRLD